MERSSGCGRSARSRAVLAAFLLGSALIVGAYSPGMADTPVLDALSVGNPLASGMMVLLEKEIANGLKARNIEANFARFRSYAGLKLDSTAGQRTGSEVTGLCRLSWYDHLMRNPLNAPIEAEQFTRKLHQGFLDHHRGLDRVLSIARIKTDCRSREPRTFGEVGSPEEALESVRRAATGAQVAHNAALAPLSRSEIRELAQHLVPVMASENNVGHTLSRISTGKRLCGLLEKLDRGAVYAAVEALVPLTSPALLEQLGLLAEAPDAPRIEGVGGSVARHVVTPAGSIVIGGREKNTYQLDEMPGASVVIDLGGDDVYEEGSCSLARPVLVVIDLEGDDVYRGSKPGIQGSAVLGISMLLDVEGDDAYRARDVAQGSCLAGAGILIDYAGNDSYLGLRRVQGQAVGGVGMLVDRKGRDAYKGAMWAQGVGGPLGFGVLDDLEGNDHYYGGGLYLNSYRDDDNPTPGYEGWAQGMGEGIRAVSNGGIGVILDGGGDDVYEFDYLSHGGGYWLGVGFARDFGGNDRRLGATLKAYNGGNRTERRYQRFGTGFGCHYACGFCFDDEGDDTYHGTIMGIGFAWDCSIGGLFDFGGNDRYEASGSTTKGVGAQAGLGILFDYQGDDVYKGRGQGYASSGISYHDLPRCGGNFSFVVDYGGKDQYGCRARNDSYNRRSSSGGFLIDRPTRQPDPEEGEKDEDEETEDADAPGAAEVTEAS